VDDTIALAALMQAIVAKLQKLRRQNVTFRSYPRRLIDENRWRASRYGLDGKLIDFGRKCDSGAWKTVAFIFVLMLTSRRFRHWRRSGLTALMHV
jgi:gamma-glutamyl:cysteine ligase YbdK (ATP-grasp superfamily)